MIIYLFIRPQVVLDRLDVPEGDSQIVNAKFVVGADGIFDYLFTEYDIYLMVLQAHTLGFANLWESKWRANRPVRFLPSFQPSSSYNPVLTA
jgi:hypothetical protein